MCKKAEGWLPKAKMTDVYCHNQTCKRSDCCEQVGQCMQIACNHGTMPKANPPKVCQSDTCRQDECCTSRGQCVKDGKIVCSKGMVPKLHRPRFCEGAECTEEECCQEAAFGSSAVRGHNSGLLAIACTWLLTLLSLLAVASALEGAM